MPDLDAKRIKRILFNPRLMGFIVVGFIIFILLANSFIKKEAEEIQPIVAPSGAQTVSLPPKKTESAQPKSDFLASQDTAAPSVSEGSPQPSEAPKEIIYELPLNEKILIQ